MFGDIFVRFSFTFQRFPKHFHFLILFFPFILISICWHSNGKAETLTPQTRLLYWMIYSASQQLALRSVVLNAQFSVETWAISSARENNHKQKSSKCRAKIIKIDFQFHLWKEIKDFTWILLFLEHNSYSFFLADDLLT